MKPKSKQRFYSLAFFDRISAHLAKMISEELAKIGYVGLSLSHFEILTFLLKSKDPVNMTRLANSIERSKPTLTILVRKLETMGLVEKRLSAEDGREWLLTLTKEAERKKKKLFAISAKVLSLRTWGISSEEEKVLFPILKRIYESLS